MKNLLTIFAVILLLAWSSGGFADKAHRDKNGNSHSGTVEHSLAGGTFTRQAVVEGVRAEFQVMSLASMNMQDPEGNTHHVMVKFFDESSQNQIKNAMGKVTLIDPSGKERVETLKNYNGIFAANLTFAEKGKYEVISLFEVDGKKRLVKFWYPHG